MELSSGVDVCGVEGPMCSVGLLAGRVVPDTASCGVHGVSELLFACY